MQSHGADLGGASMRTRAFTFERRLDAVGRRLHGGLRYFRATRVAVELCTPGFPEASRLVSAAVHQHKSQDQTTTDYSQLTISLPAGFGHIIVMNFESFRGLS